MRIITKALRQRCRSIEVSIILVICSRCDIVILGGSPVNYSDSDQFAVIAVVVQERKRLLVVEFFPNA